LKRKEVDDVLGGAAAWENVDSTEGTVQLPMLTFAIKRYFLSHALHITAECPKCGHGRAYFMQIQIRSADEPSSIFYKCCNEKCQNQWREG
jgi:DNA-directed RNA polymerase III subunit RPC11